MSEIDEIIIETDDFTDMANDFDQQWILRSFNPHEVNYAKNPYEWLDVARGRDANGDPYFVRGALEDFQNNWKFVCSCYQHSGTVWSLKGEGPQCQWDTTQIAGILEPRDDDDRDYMPQTPEERRESARRWLRDYNDWANGSIYEVTVGDENLGSWFLHDAPAMLGAIRKALVEQNIKRFRLEGDACELFRDDLSGIMEAEFVHV